MTGKAEANGLARAVRARHRQLAQRVMMAGLVCLTTSHLVGWTLSGVWVACYAVAQVVESWAWTPISSGRTDDVPLWRMVVGCLAVTCNAALFGGISIPLWMLGGSFGGVVAAFVICSAVINTVVHTPGSRTLFACAVGPQFVYVAMVPFLFGYFGGSRAFQSACALGALVFCAYTFILWRAMEATRRAEASAQAESRRKHDELEAMMAAKSVFVATVSHELRTPISAMTAGAAELERLADTPEARSHARLIADAGKMMRTLLDDILDHAKLEAGRMTVESEPFALRDLVAQTARFWRSEARKKGLDLRVEGIAALPRRVEGDPTRIRQILNNLISNAVKFTQTGSVSLVIAAWPAEDDSCAVRLQVVDTGTGMDADQVARLFTAFEQTDAGRRYGGTGLGLVISRQLARLMGGQLTAVSTKGAGSTFTLALTFRLADAGVELADLGDDSFFVNEEIAAEALSAAPVSPEPAASEPVQAEPIEEQAVQEEAEERPIRVLVADDHEINRRAVQLVLAPTGALITAVADGRAAVEAAAAEAFDLIVMDVRMPEMTGREATRRIRATPGPNQHVPIIAVTADSEKEDVQACREAGMDWFCAKPIDPSRLIETVVAALEQAQTGAPTADQRVA
jgi:signal transduction histidine kinase/ActR/RegA family two-component response regulator